MFPDPFQQISQASMSWRGELLRARCDRGGVAEFRPPLTLESIFLLLVIAIEQRRFAQCSFDRGLGRCFERLVMSDHNSLEIPLQ